MNQDYLDELYVDIKNIDDGTMMELAQDLINELDDRGYILEEMLETIRLSMRHW